jgi:hypothetical protein
VFLSQLDVEEAYLLRVHLSNRTELIALFPYLGPELIAAILKRESTSAVDLRKDSKSVTENSFPAIRSQSAVNEKPALVSFRRKASWLRCHRLFAVVGRLVAPWFP